MNSSRKYRKISQKTSVTLQWSWQDCPKFLCKIYRRSGSICYFFRSFLWKTPQDVVTGWSLGPFSTQTVLWFCDSFALTKALTFFSQRAALFWKGHESHPSIFRRKIINRWLFNITWCHSDHEMQQETNSLSLLLTLYWSQVFSHIQPGRKHMNTNALCVVPQSGHKAPASIREKFLPLLT